MRIAYFSPLNPIKSGISDYSEELLECLEGYGSIDLFVDGYSPSASWLHEEFKISNYEAFYKENANSNYDITIYHVGNSDNHAYIWKTLQKYPGLVVLHEPILHHFVFSQTVGNNMLGDYLRELDYSYNSRRFEIVKTTLEARDENSWYKYPLVERIIDASLGIIVHSEFAKEIVQGIRPRAPVRKIFSHFAPPSAAGRSPELLRETLGFMKDDFLVGSFGYMTASKQIDVLLKTIAMVKAAGYSIKLLLVGKGMPGCDIHHMIEELDIEEDVIVTGFIDTQAFWEYLRIPDVCVALRCPSAGETSGSVVKLMGSGCTVVVSDHMAFSEFPDDCCVKIPIGDGEAEELARRFISFIENPNESRLIGHRARTYVEQYHNIHASARDYMEFIREILSGRHA